MLTQVHFFVEHRTLRGAARRLVVFCAGWCWLTSSPAIAQTSLEAADKNNTVTQTVDVPTGTFSVFLRESGPVSLWMDDLLARWRKTDDAQAKLRWSFELSLWLERELQRAESSEIRRLYPQLWNGPHVSEPAFAPVQLIELRKQLNQLALQAFEKSLHNIAQESVLVELAAVQRQLREAAENLNQLASNPEIAAPSLQSIQLQQLKEAAEAGLAWSYYYEWLLTPAGQVDSERLQQAMQIHMRLLGITEPDLRPADWYRWFDASRGSGNDWLLGLGLCSAALQRSDVASTCFATLQRQGDRRLSQRVVLWHAHGLLKLERWDDAILLVATYAQNPRVEEVDSFDSMVNTMLAWVNPSIPEGTSNDVRPDLPKPVANWNWRLIELLVSMGKVEEAARLIGKYRVDNPGTGLTSQVLLLHSLLVERQLSDRSQPQLTQLVERLSLWANSETVGPNKLPREIERWALHWLAKVHLAQGEIGAAQAMMFKHFEATALEDATRRQSIAWDLAQSFERSADVDMQARRDCLKWYREAANYPNLAQTANARIKARLWELAGQPLAQTAYLKSFVSADDGYMFARRQLIVRLFEDYLTSPLGTENRIATAAHLQQEVWEQLGLSMPNQQADEATWVAWQNQLAQQLEREAQAGNDNSSAALLAVGVQTLDIANSGEVQPLQAAVLAVCVRHALAEQRERMDAWRSVLYTAAISWDKNPWLVHDASLRQKTVDVLLQERMTPVQTHSLLERTVPELRMQWEQVLKLSEVIAEGEPSIRQLPSTIRLQELYRRWWESLQTINSGIDSRSVERVQLDYAEFMWRIGEGAMSQVVLETPKPSTASVNWRRQYARTLSQLKDPNQQNAADELWLELSEQYATGSPDWLEAKYYLLRHLMSHDAAQAKIVYQQIRQLYPVIPPPWAAAYDRLAAQHGW